MPSCEASERTSCASGGPSTSTMSGSSAFSAARTLLALPGPWCRMPKTWTLIESQHVHACAVEILPAGAFLDDGLQVLEPHDAVLDGILDDGAREPRGEVACAKHAVAEVA